MTSTVGTGVGFMGISLKSQKMLWGKAANRCAFPDCHRELIVDPTKTDDESIIGEVCHIVAKEPGGPRGCSRLSAEELDDYDNLILLCRNHHKEIDDQPEKYTAEFLHQLKTSHEKRVKDRLDADASKMRDDELCASWIEEWATRVSLDDWSEWTAHLLDELEPWMTAELDTKLSEASKWLLSRTWPRRYPNLESAFENFRLVLDDFQTVFRRHAERIAAAEEIWKVPRFYKIRVWDPKRYNRLLRQYGYHLQMIVDLTLELTRAANYVCDKAREYIVPWFRLKEGALVAEPGLCLSASGRTSPQYRDKERASIPYPGLRTFEINRRTRDVYFKWPH